MKEAWRKRFYTDFFWKLAVVFMSAAFVMLFLPWARRGDRVAYTADDTFVEERLQQLSASEYGVPSPEDGYTTDELLALYELPFSEAEYLQIANGLEEISAGPFYTLWDEYRAALSRDKLKSLEQIHTTHAALTSWSNHSYEESSVNSMTYREYNDRGEAASGLLFRMMALLLLFVFSLLLCRMRFLFGILPFTLYGFLFYRWYRRAEDLFFYSRRYDSTVMQVLFPVFLALAITCLLLRLFNKEEWEPGPRTKKAYLPFAIPVVLFFVLSRIYGRDAHFTDIRIVWDKDIRYIIHGNMATVAGFQIRETAMKELVIPNSVEGVPVVSALCLRPVQSEVEEITKDSVVTCERLVLPDSVRVLWGDAWNRGNGPDFRVGTVDLGEGLVWLNTGRRVLTAGDDIFDAGADVIIPESVRYMAAEAFCGTSMRSVQFAQGTPMRIIPPGCFRGCPNLEEVTLPDSVETIGEEAFADCTALRRVQGFDKTGITLYAGVFQNTPFAKSREAFGTGFPVIIHGELMDYYTAADTVTLPAEVTYLQPDRFSGVFSELVIPKNSSLSNIRLGRQGDPVNEESWRHPLTLHFEGNAGDDILSDAMLWGGGKTVRDSIGLWPHTGVIWEAKEGSGVLLRAAEAGYPYRFSDADDTKDKAGYYVLYRQQAAVCSYNGPEVYTVETVWSENGSGKRRCHLDIYYRENADEAGRGKLVDSFEITDFPETGFAHVPVSAIGWFCSMPNSMNYLSVYCGTPEAGKSEQTREDHFDGLFRLYRMPFANKNNIVTGKPVFEDMGFYVLENSPYYDAPIDVEKDGEPYTE